MIFRPVVVLVEEAVALVADYQYSGACAAGEHSCLLVDTSLEFPPFVLFHFPAVPVVANDGGGLLRQAHRLEYEVVLSVHGLENESWGTAQLPRAVGQGNPVGVVYLPVPASVGACGSLAEISHHREGVLGKILPRDCRDGLVIFDYLRGVRETVRLRQGAVLVAEQEVESDE